MGRVLKHGTFVRQNPPAGPVIPLKAGDEVPDWAEGMVGEHLFEDDRGAKAAPKEVDRSPIKLPDPAPEPEKELTVPKRGASAAAWRKFSTTAGVKPPSKATRDEIIELVLEAYPELEIPEDD